MAGVLGLSPRATSPFLSEVPAVCGSSPDTLAMQLSCLDGPQRPQHLSLLTAAKSPSAQLMEQVAQLKSLSDTIEKLKVSHSLPLPH